MKERTWKERANRRRDLRQEKTPNEVPPPGAASAGKDTKRWCRGKVGVEHQPKCMGYNDLKGGGRIASMSRDWKILACTVCGKELAYWYPFGSRKNNPKPEWVT